ncbi:hypothetical protein CONCODRAFT_4115 [Conidiobolus coronatus NRRL 28638]|uniref:7TM GPCR serpentine receptor class x (Srx) domain-containing protein n=1 Tax=Conidiobolus coronatus (strain ATCC 28846 / CBS 209.66 / NRRL 28638) TaxID=796925 RepID=A0A137PD81_CONC2|nr:hypothetical protein CONCODRAFT_4115 [Conidiobolus coronatus NRRL 28638]|eukprot:KXN72969.1 hypothetical protein CONCODRAFT_4115 [Conidiobolus coronatus NRRL 28638]
MAVDLCVQLLSVGSVAAIAMLLLNNITYWTILDLKYSDKLNIICQFIGLFGTLAFQADLLLINLDYFKDYPMAEVLIINVPWQVYSNCYFIIFIRQSNVLLPRKLELAAWIYLILVINGLAVFDGYAYYMEYCVSEEWTWLGNLADSVASISFLFLECVVNGWIIVKLTNKVRNQSNPGYKILVTKLCSVLVLYFIMDMVNMALDITDNQMYGCIFWGITYAIKIQTETLCLGKIKECVIILETFENA